MTFNRSKFYAELRKSSVKVFGSRLSAPQVEGMEAILDEAISRGTPLNHTAYFLATPYLETGKKMQPVRENLNYSVQGLLKTFGRHRISVEQAKRYGRTKSQKANQEAIANIIYGGKWGRDNLGNTMPGDGWRYRGSGVVQQTGRRNFAKFGMDRNPDQMSDLRTSIRIMFDAMIDGDFTDKKLSDFTTYVGMRQTVNGTDKDDEIAAYAKSFEHALKVAGYDGKATQKPVQAPKPKTRPTPKKTTKPKPVAKNKPIGKKSSIAAAIIAAGAIVTGWAKSQGWF